MATGKITLEKLVELYEKLKKRVDSLDKDIGLIMQQNRKIIKRLEHIEKVLEREGILVPYHKIVEGNTIVVHYWANKSEAKKIEKEGLKPTTFFPYPPEHKLLYSILRKRGINLPDKVIVGYLAPMHMVYGKIRAGYVPFKFVVDLKYVYVADRPIYDFLTSLTDTQERLEILREFALTIEPSSKFIKEKHKDWSDYIALVTVPIPPDNIRIEY